MRQKYLLLAALLLAIPAHGSRRQDPGVPPNSQAPTQDSAAQKANQATCTVSGMVVKLAGSEPIKSALVRLRKADELHQGYGTLTDTDGHFELKKVEPGRYRLEVSRTGFVTQQFGQKTPNDPGALLTLSPGENLSDRLFRLIPSAVIAGKIMDEDGQPLSSVMVSAMREVYTEGKRKLSIQNMNATNDLGEFRLFDLPPGRYFLSALYSPRQWRGDNFKELGESKNDRGYVTTYYPGSPDPTKASPIVIKSGEELRSMDMLLTQVGVYKIRGRVFNTVTHRTANDVYLNLTPKNSRFVWNMGNFTSVQKDGSFELHNVLSGTYTLSTFWYDEGKSYSARQTVEVANADIEGLTLTIAPAITIEGRLIWEGNPSIEEQELKVFASGGISDYENWGGQARVMANGAFTLKDISEGTYTLNVGGISQDCYIKNTRYGTSDATAEGFTVQRGTDAALEVTVSSRGARIKGSVADADGLPAAGVWVVLVPDQARRAGFRLYKSKTTDQHGSFELRGIAPGDYKLFSWEEVESGSWEDPEFLKEFEAKGEKISLQDGDQKTQNLTAIRIKTPEPQKP